MAGLAHEEMSPVGGLTYRFMDRHDFVIDPLPNLLFTRDSSVWIRDSVAVTSLAMPARMRETSLTQAIYRHHPRFAGTQIVHGPDNEPVEGGDVLLLSPGVVAVGVGRAHDAGRRRAAGPHGVRPRAGAAPSWRCRSPRSGRRCTSTRSARWSTSTPS